MPRINREKAARRRISAFPLLQPPPGFRSFMDDLFAYSSGQKRLYAAHLTVTLCRFGRWLSWALCPWLRFFPGWTDSVDGAMSWEMKAQLTLRPNPNLPMLMAMPIGGLLFAKSFGIKKGA